MNDCFNLVIPIKHVAKSWRSLSVNLSSLSSNDNVLLPAKQTNPSSLSSMHEEARTTPDDIEN